jgi:hypothetical protein
MFPIVWRRESLLGSLYESRDMDRTDERDIADAGASAAVATPISHCGLLILVGSVAQCDATQTHLPSRRAKTSMRKSVCSQRLPS